MANAEPVEVIHCRLDVTLHAYVLFFPHLRNKDGSLTTWTEGEGHGSANPQDGRFVTPTHRDGAEDAFRKYRKQYRGNFRLSLKAPV